MGEGRGAKEGSLSCAYAYALAAQIGASFIHSLGGPSKRVATMTTITEVEEDDQGAVEATVQSPAIGEWQDIMSNGAVLKQIVRKSPVEPHQSPEFKQQVIVHVVGRTSKEPSRVFQNTREDAKPIQTWIGDQILDFVPPGLMLGIRTMAVGELARVKLQSRFAYGHGGHWFGLEPDADVEFEVELLQIGDFTKEVPDMSAEELRDAVRLYKNRGNEWYKWNELERAIRCYKEGVRFGDGALQQMEDEKKPITLDDEVVKDRIACMNNIATVLERQGKLKEAMEMTVSVLEADPTHLKALIRAARVAVLQGSHEEAQAAVAAAVAIAPNNEAVIKVKKDLDDRIAKHKQQEKQRWGGFLKPVSKEEAERLRQAEDERRRKAEAEKPSGDGANLEAKREKSSEETKEASRELEQLVKELVEKSDNEDGVGDEDLFKEDAPERRSLFTPDVLELIARLVVLLSPTAVFLFALLLWRIFSI